ncbi:hypothetical protein A9Q84_15240 [Halobacteriovorax marinus]|uniref:Glutaredoxin domain-containing protein n=1 Tax=Halobacteriovorax marinus TaxID=97084 RepID=A0A1Y5F5B6_9BACT|nr:hypothetical protein A9Q84_15240 [Halobacteriovorax marinus]
MKIQVYVKDYCPYCNEVESYLIDNKIEYERVDLSDNAELYMSLKKATGHHTVPQVFIDDKFVGGADDFRDLVRKDKIA